MRQLCAATLTLLALGCPPPHYLDIFNNTGAPLEIGDQFELGAGESGQFKAWAVFDRWEKTESSGKVTPILRLKVQDQCVDYFFETAQENWVHKNGSLTAGLFLQVDQDLSVRLAGLDDPRPIPKPYAQPEGWPLRPRAGSSLSSADDSDRALITFFRLDGNGRKSVFIDETEIARLPNKRQFTVSVSPGQRRINAETQGNDPIVVDLKSGQHYYVQLNDKFWAVGEDVKVVNEKVAKAALLGCLPNSCELNFDPRIKNAQPEAPSRPEREPA